MFGTTFSTANEGTSFYYPNSRNNISLYPLTWITPPNLPHNFYMLYLTELPPYKNIVINVSIGPNNPSPVYTHILHYYRPIDWRLKSDLLISIRPLGRIQIHGSVDDLSILSRDIQNTYLDYRPVSGKIYVRFPSLNVTYPLQYIKNYYIALGGVSYTTVFNATGITSDGRQVGLTLRNVTSTVPPIENYLPNFPLDNFFNLDEPIYTVEYQGRNYTCNYLSGNLYCTSTYSSEFFPYLNQSLSYNPSLSPFFVAKYMRCLIRQDGADQKTLYFTALFSNNTNVSVNIIRSNGNTTQNYTNVLNISLQYSFNYTREKVYITVNNQVVCKSYGFFEDFVRIPLLGVFLALIIIGMAVSSVQNPIALTVLSYLIFEAGLFISASYTYIAYAVAFLFAIYTVLNKPTEDSFRVALTLVITLLTVVFQITTVMPTLYSTSDTYLSDLKNSLDSKLANLRTESIDSAILSIPPALLSLMLFPLEVILKIPRLLVDVINLIWPPMGYYLSSLIDVLYLLGLVNILTRLVEVLLNRFRKT